MNYYYSLNNLIEEIEKSLTQKIEYKDLAKIIGTSSYTLQRIFEIYRDTKLPRIRNLL